MDLFRAAVMLCDCQEGALVFFEDQQKAGRVAYNMQRRIETGAPEIGNEGRISFRLCANVEVGRCPACDKELAVTEILALPENQPR